MRWTRQAGVRGHRGQDGQGVVQAAVMATHDTRPGVGAHAGQHAAWWARNSATLHLIADHENDPARARTARADAATAQRLAQAMAADHAATAADHAPVPEAVAGHEPAAVELPAVSDLNVLEAGL